MAAAESPGSAEVTGVSRSTRAKMASFLYPSREESEQESALLELEASLAAAAPAAWKGFSFMAWEAKATEEAKMSGGDAAALAAATPSVETDTDTAASAAATTIQAHFKGRRERRRTRVQLEANRRDAAATTIQAHFKGRRERRRIYGRDTSSEAAVTSLGSGAGVGAPLTRPYPRSDDASAAASACARELSALLSVLVRLTVLPAFVGVIIGLAFRIGCYVALLHGCAATHIGWVLTQIPTTQLNSHPTGCETFRLWPWITYPTHAPLAHATNFYYANSTKTSACATTPFSMRYDGFTSTSTSRLEARARAPTDAGPRRGECSSGVKCGTTTASAPPVPRTPDCDN